MQKGVAFANVKGILYPCVAFGVGGEVSVNFGKKSFVYDIAGHDWTAGQSAAAIVGRKEGRN